MTLIHAGLPIIQAVELLTKRQRNLYFRSLLQNVRDRLRSGEALSEAFEAQRSSPRSIPLPCWRVNAAATWKR